MVRITIKSVCSFVINLLSLFCAVFFMSCNSAFERGLDFAGENRKELELLLDKYEGDGDGIKLRAAKFMVVNMPFLYTKTSEAADSFAKSILYADTMRSRSLAGLWTKYKTTDSMTIEYDSKTLTAAYLADNIDKAVKVWYESAWKDEVSEDLFLNYILPYRSYDEALSPIGWRDTLYNKYHSVIDTITDLKRAFHAVYRAASTEVRVRNLGNISYLLNSVDISHIKRGRCLQQCVYIVSVMRALGIPAVVDGVMRWANYSSTGHSWVALVTADGTYTVYVGDKEAKKYNPINSSSFSLKYPVEKDYPVDLTFVKRVGKVWRSSFAIVEPDYDDPAAPFETRAMFSRCHSVDVSDEYGFNGKYKTSVPWSTDCAYLCVFATGADWIPICYSKARLGKCSFNHLVDSVVYNPMVYESGKLRPVGRPFFIDGGKIIKIKPDPVNRQSLSLTRKYPFAKSILRPWQETSGSFVVAANRKDFKDADTLFRMNRTPVFRNVVTFDSLKCYRYIWYASNPNKRGSILEFRVYHNDMVLRGTPFSKGVEKTEQCFDDDTSTGLSNLTVGYTIGLDLGKPIEVDSVAFYLRNDGNYIDPGDEYELLHYDNGWCSIAKRKAVYESLAFDNIPVGALLLLKNRTKGSEERIFTYEEGRQVWW